MVEATTLKGHRWFAAGYDRIMATTEKKLGPRVRPQILGDLSGRILEIGAGTGASFQHYPRSTQVVAIEPDPFMLRRAREKLDEHVTTNVELLQLPAEELPFDNASFDHTVSTLVLCSVSDQSRALSEVRRVLKPGGTLRFWEHVRNDESAFYGKLQDIIQPVWSWIGAGCHPNRRTQSAIEDAGFHIESIDRQVEFPGVPMVWGVARAT